MTKYIFVTGGVVSSLGKGIASASLAALLEARGIKVTMLKLDPYINVDPGTMSPYQHGEVVVTADGADVAMVEIGGTVGDIESQPFLEAIRQMGVEMGTHNVVYMHLTLVPYIGAAGEMKTKPTQHSVKELRSIGIQPDVLLGRADRLPPEDDRRKIALFTNVPVRAVIPAVNVDNIYKSPGLLHEQGLDEIVVEKLHFNAPKAKLGEWERVVQAMEHHEGEVEIALVGKYVHLTESYKSLSEALP